MTQRICGECKEWNDFVSSTPGNLTLEFLKHSFIDDVTYSVCDFQSELALSNSVTNALSEHISLFTHMRNKFVLKELSQDLFLALSLIESINCKKIVETNCVISSTQHFVGCHRWVFTSHGKALIKEYNFSKSTVCLFNKTLELATLLSNLRERITSDNSKLMYLKSIFDYYTTEDKLYFIRSAERWEYLFATSSLQSIERFLSVTQNHLQFLLSVIQTRVNRLFGYANCHTETYYDCDERPDNRDNIYCEHKTYCEQNIVEMLELTLNLVHSILEPCLEYLNIEISIHLTHQLDHIIVSLKTMFTQERNITMTELTYEEISQQIIYKVCSLGTSLINYLDHRSQVSQSMENKKVYQLFVTLLLFCVWPYVRSVIQVLCFRTIDKIVEPKLFSLPELFACLPELFEVTKSNNMQQKFNNFSFEQDQLFIDVRRKTLQNKTWLSSSLSSSLQSSSFSTPLSANSMYSWQVELFETILRAVFNKFTHNARQTADDKIIQIKKNCKSTSHTSSISKNIEDLLFDDMHLSQNIRNLPLIVNVSQENLCEHSYRTKKGEPNEYLADELIKMRVTHEEFLDNRYHFPQHVANEVFSTCWVLKGDDESVEVNLSIQRQKVCLYNIENRNYDDNDFNNHEVTETGNLIDTLHMHEIHSVNKLYYIDGTLPFREWIQNVLLIPINRLIRVVEEKRLEYLTCVPLLSSSIINVRSAFTQSQFHLSILGENSSQCEQMTHDLNINARDKNTMQMCNIRQMEEHFSPSEKNNSLNISDAFSLVINIALFVNNEEFVTSFVNALVNESYWLHCKKAEANYNGAYTSCKYLSSFFAKSLENNALGIYAHLIINLHRVLNDYCKCNKQGEKHSNSNNSKQTITHRTQDEGKRKQCANTKRSIFSAHSPSKVLITFGAMELYFTFPEEICCLLGVRHLRNAPKLNECEQNKELEKAKGALLNKEDEYKMNASRVTTEPEENGKICKWSALFRSQCILHYTCELTKQRRRKLVQTEHNRAIRKAVLGSNNISRHKLQKIYSLELKIVYTMHFTISSILQFTRIEVAKALSSISAKHCQGRQHKQLERSLKEQVTVLLNELIHIIILWKTEGDQEYETCEYKQNVSMFIQNILNECINECHHNNEEVFVPDTRLLHDASTSLIATTPSSSSSSSTSLSLSSHSSSRNNLLSTSNQRLNAQLKNLQSTLNTLHECNRHLINFIINYDEFDKINGKLTPLAHMLTFNNFYS